MPLYYRIPFTIFDIILPLYGVYAKFATPDAILSQGFGSKLLLPRVAETTMLLDSSAGWDASLAFMSTYFLMNKPHDQTVWIGINGGTLLVDFFMLFALGRCLHDQNRLSPSTWTGIEYGNVVGYTVIALMRITFLCNFGTRKFQVDKKEL